MYRPGPPLADMDFLNILENSSDGIVMTDAEGVIFFFNPAAEQLTGFVASEVLGHTSAELLTSNMISLDTPAIVLKTKKQHTAIVHYANGYTACAVSSPLFGLDGEIYAVWVRLHNVTPLDEDVVLSEGKSGGVFSSRAMQRVLALANSLANVDTTLLITGESGTGKDVLARYIHGHGPRKNARFVKINCGALPETLLESELFGYEPGAFTGAGKRGKKGLVEEAENGTLFMDEIAEIPLPLQAKLLEFLQDFQFYPLGGTAKRSSHVRVITATNQNLEELVRIKAFRADLYYRLNVVQIVVPPLRERQPDIMPLMERYIGIFNEKYSRNRQLHDTCRSVLVTYPWPGNIRELVNLCERLVVTNEQRLILPEEVDRALHLTTTGQIVQNRPEYVTESSAVSTEQVPEQTAQANQPMIPAVHNTRPTAESGVFSMPSESASGSVDFKNARDDFERRLFEPLVSQGLSTYAIARQLGMSQSSVSRKVRRLFPKVAS